MGPWCTATTFPWNWEMSQSSKVEYHRYLSYLVLSLQSFYVHFIYTAGYFTEVIQVKYLTLPYLGRVEQLCPSWGYLLPETLELQVQFPNHCAAPLPPRDLDMT